ncbi:MULTISPECIES: hypothetical protein [unclassified Pseudomonas]|nr:hypothetical protein [Pseudomonas sp. 10-1B]
MTEIVAALQALMTDQSLSFGEPWACLRTFNVWFLPSALPRVGYR